MKHAGLYSDLLQAFKGESELWVQKKKEEEKDKKNFDGGGEQGKKSMS